MKHPLLACMAAILSLTFLSGCWDEKAIQDLRYLSAIGVDYENDEYVLYAQATELSGVSKKENTGDSPSPPAVISIGRGKSMQNAIDNMQKNSQVPQFYGFISSLIFHERVLRKGILPTLDVMNRNGLMRYTKWVFATNEPLSKVLRNHSATGSSPLVSILHEPLDVYQQRSFIKPIQCFTFIKQFWEPSHTVLLPNITIYKRSWKEDDRFVSRLTFNGVHAIHRGKWKGFFLGKDLLGLRWMDPDTYSSGIVIMGEKEPTATLRIQYVHLRIEPIGTTAKPRFRATIYLKGFVREVMGPVTVDLIRKEAVKQVKEQVRSTFAKGIKAGTDLYSLETVLYRKDLPRWKQFARDHSRTMPADALAELEVHLQLSDSGKMKMKWYEYPEDLLP